MAALHSIKIIVAGRKENPFVRSQEEISRSKVGTNAILAIGLLTVKVSFEMPWLSIIAAYETKLVSVWLYAAQKNGAKRIILHAAKA